MIDYLKILELHSLDYSQRQISSLLGVSPNTVRDTIKACKILTMGQTSEISITNTDIYHALHPGMADSKSGRRIPDYNYIHKELGKKGVNLSLLWSEYDAQCETEGMKPYMSTQFNELYNRWARAFKATMPMKHKPGEVLEIDWAGTPLHYEDPVTGDLHECSLFAAVLPCSCYTYAQVCEDEKIASVSRCLIQAFEYFGGVTRLLVPDNMRTAVTLNTRYETLLNPTMADLSRHYGTAVVPTRIRHAKDKPHAEGGVKFATTWITAALRNERFFSFSELTVAVGEKLENLNTKPFKKRPGNRRVAYENEEKSFMSPLPASRFEVSDWTSCSVPANYLVTDGLNYYSVPYDLIGKTVDIRITDKVIEVFFHDERVASHIRLGLRQNDPVVKKEHMPVNHQKYLEYNSECFLKWASDTGPWTEKVVKKFLEQGDAPEQGYKYCVSIQNLGERYGKALLEECCRHILEISPSPSLRAIATLVKSMKQESATSPSRREKVPTGRGITRGSDYFSKQIGDIKNDKPADHENPAQPSSGCNGR